MASPIPSAVNPAERSSSRTWTPSRVGGQGQGQRRRPRAGADHGVVHTGPHPLVDQGGGEGGLDIGMAGVAGGARYAHRARHADAKDPNPHACRPPTGARSTPRSGRRAAPGAGPRIHPDRAGVGRARRRPGPGPPGGGRGHARPRRVRRGALDLVDGALQLGAVGGRAAYLGYSMGARFCLHLALARPELVDRWCSSRARPASRTPTSGASAVRSDGALADRLDPADGDRPGQPVEEFLRRWMANPMFVGVGARGRRVRRAAGQHRAGTGLEPALAGTGTQLPLWGKLERLTMPVLVMTGGDDAKFTRLGRRLVDAIGRPRPLAVVPGAGHAPHLQHPEVVAGLVRSHRRPGPAELSPGLQSSGHRRDPERHPQPQGHRQQHAEGQLEAAGGGQHGQEGPPVGIAPDEPDRARPGGAGPQGEGRR